MIESQIELNEKRKELFEKLCKDNPDLGTLVKSTVSCVYADGAIDRKMKFLMALGIALSLGCRICVLAQLTSAIDCGATRTEIMEVLSVVYSMKGTTGTAEALRVVQYIDEIGL